MTPCRVDRFFPGWGRSPRSGGAADTFVTTDRSVARPQERVPIERRGRNLRAGEADLWTRTSLCDEGLHDLVGATRCPKAA